MMTHHVMIGVQLLSQLVCEMNQVSEVWFWVIIILLLLLRVWFCFKIMLLPLLFSILL